MSISTSKQVAIRQLALPQDSDKHHAAGYPFRFGTALDTSVSSKFMKNLFGELIWLSLAIFGDLQSRNMNETTDDVKVLPDQKEMTYYANVYRSALEPVLDLKERPWNGVFRLCGLIDGHPPH